jgi:hypothetical protein
MIIYIDKRLQQWAIWRISGKVLPVIARSSWQALSGQSEARAMVPTNDIECKDIDTCVCALEPDLKLTVLEAYTRVGTVETAAKRCGITPRTLFRRLDKAHYQILGWLNDLAAGIPVPAWTMSDGAKPVEPIPERPTAVVLPERLPGKLGELLPLIKSEVLAPASQKC